MYSVSSCPVLFLFPYKGPSRSATYTSLRKCTSEIAAIRRFDEEIATWRVRIEQSEAENARYAEQIESQKGAIAAIEEHLNSKTDERAGLFEQVSRLEDFMRAVGV